MFPSAQLDSLGMNEWQMTMTKSEGDKHTLDGLGVDDNNDDLCIKAVVSEEGEGRRRRRRRVT